jgi:starvation-inducible DNA-binding protein
MPSSELQKEIKISHLPVAAALQRVLANTYGLYLATHNYHWNVEGRNFASLHSLFGAQYNELFLAIDVIAERIRALGEYALPFEGDNITHISSMTSNALNKETDAEARTDRMIHNLMALTDDVIESCQSAKEEAQDVEDNETEDMMITRISAHQNSLWMLGSILK